MSKIPVTVIVTVKNEERNIERCLRALKDFSEIIVADSNSDDETAALAQVQGVRVEQFVWNGKYPKKRQWCLEHLDIKHDWVLWIDADEEMTRECVSEIRALFCTSMPYAGYFLPSQYVCKGKILHYGMKNNKIALMDKRKMKFPVIDDIWMQGMGEMEGHYQPVLKTAFSGEKIGQISKALIHHAYEDENAWERRHKHYARWEAEMTVRKTWACDPVLWREIAKRLVRRFPLRPHIMFSYSYIWKCGFLDGRAGYEFACSRKRYCHMIFKEIEKLK